MPPDELIPRPKNELSFGQANSKEITSRMAEDLLAIRKDDVLDDAVVHFKCKNLEKALREQIDIPDRPIFRQDLKNFVGKIFLSWLPLFGDEITDITPLKDMTQLKELSLHDNFISDISVLEGMTRLEHLYLGNTKNSDLSPIKNMTQLKELSLHDNFISDISPLESMTLLTVLNLSSNQISDISALENIDQLTHLGLPGNQISDISILESMTQLEELDLWDNQISETQIEMLQEALPDCNISF